MTRAARNVLHFQRRKPARLGREYAISGCVDMNENHMRFLRQHTGGGPDPMTLRLSWLQIIARVAVLVPAAYILYLMVRA